MTAGSREQFILSSLQESSEMKQRIAKHCVGDISKAIDVLLAALKNRKKVLLCGNGGSAADAQHLATEFVIRLNPAIKRPGLPAIALTTDTSNLTAGANDIGYDNVFARSVEALGNEGDVLIGISTSGNSESVNRAFSKAREKKNVNHRVPRKRRRKVQAPRRRSDHRARQRYPAHPGRAHYHRPHYFPGS